MFFKTIAAIGLIVAVSAAPAYAWGGKRGGNDSAVAGVSGAFGSAASPGSETGGSPVASASEPLAALAVGLGLLGARLLRRR
jgi:hypothetical protein